MSPTQQSSSSLEQLQKLLLQEHEALNTMLAAIVKETDALTQRAFEMLQETSEEKQALFNQLSTLTESHTQLLKDAGFDSNADGMAGFIDSVADKETRQQINKLWDDNTALLMECRRQNEANGLVIEHNNHAMGVTMSILSGEIFSTQESALYDAKGNASKQPQGGSNKPIAKA